MSFIVADEINGALFIQTPCEGAFYQQNGKLGFFCSLLETRNEWSHFLGLPYYFDLIRRSIESRQRVRGDMEFCEWEDDRASIKLEFKMLDLPNNLGIANEEIHSRLLELEEPALQLSNEIGKLGSDIARKASGFGDQSLEALLFTVQSSKDPSVKGRALEELTAKLFESVPGFRMAGQLRTVTATEEIDISLLNASTNPVMSREAAFILVECKNWSGKCGRSEFSLLREKMQNRKDRCSLGFLVSWNGFNETITKEMLRGSREKLLIVPLTGVDIRKAIQAGSFEKVLLEGLYDAIHL